MFYSEHKYLSIVLDLNVLINKNQFNLNQQLMTLQWSYACTSPLNIFIRNQKTD